MQTTRFCLFIFITFAVTSFAQSSPQVSTLSTALPAVYQHWLDEDVHWIISTDEQKAFQGLTDNHERDRFITQFWLRRDPTPGTSENEFKEEHYRRLAYSNQNFASGTLGDLTDRGRIYVVYGPPDFVGHRTVDGVSAEFWRYEAFSAPGQFVGYSGKQPRSGKLVILEFLDRCQCGDYQLATPLLN